MGEDRYTELRYSGGEWANCRETIRGHFALLYFSCFLSCSEKDSSEKVAQAAQVKAELLQLECERLQKAVTSAQRERDHEREEKEAAMQEKERAKSESQRM